MTRRAAAIAAVAIALSIGLVRCDPLMKPAVRAVRCRTVVFTPPGVDARHGDLCGPSQPRDRVAILVIHGGGGSQGDRHSSVAWVERFNAAGYLTFAIDYFTFTNETRPPVYPREEQEVKTAVEYLRAQANAIGIDGDRIVAQGISAGGQLAAALLVTPEDPAFDWPGRWPGVSDRVGGLIALYGYYDGYQLNPAKMYGGLRASADPAVRDRYARADLTVRAAAASGPALLFAGGGDTLIPPDQTTRFAAALHAAGKDVEATIVPGEGHGFDHPGGPNGLSPAGEKVAVVAFAWLTKYFAGQ